jgi:hypothetical protein
MLTTQGIKMEYKRKPIENYDGYEIDTNGVVYTSRRGNTWNILKPRNVSQVSYHAVSLYDNPKKPKQLLVHRLVYQTFVGPIPSHMQVDHIDHNKTNNKLSNLQLLSVQDNMKKAWDRRGRSERKEIAKIWLERGYTRKFICDNLKLSQPYVSMIANGKR